MKIFPLSFRTKLLLSMIAVVVGVTGATFLITQNRIQEAYRGLFEQQFRREIEIFNDLQETRLNTVKARCTIFAKSVRLRSAMRRLNAAVESNDKTDLGDAVERLFQTASDELREIADFTRAEELTDKAPFFCFLDATGQPHFGQKLLQLLSQRQRTRSNFKFDFAVLSKALTNNAPQQVGFLATDLRGQRELREIVLTKIQSNDETLGALVLGFPVAFPEDKNGPASGIWFDGEIYTKTISLPVKEPIAKIIGPEVSKKLKGEFPFRSGEEDFRVYFERITNRDSSFLPAFQVCVSSMAEAMRQQKHLRAGIISLGLMALVAGIFLVHVLIHGFAGPILKLARATEDIGKGNFAVRVPVRSRDEIGQLTRSFNEMADGLVQREKYRDALNKVADKRIAQELADGKITLGGEVRKISVLFCDIRGFTALTQGMPPAEVIEMLNEHMTLLTRVANEHDGLVDKFVGDLIMVIFGAPRSAGNDARSAARCALEMIRKRQQLNQTSKHKIQIGIGVASGEAVAGCMGSSDRLNYTVLGERVNLASRLCSQAGRDEVVIDQNTFELLGDAVSVQPMPELKLKGFSGTVCAYKLQEIRSQPETK